MAEHNVDDVAKKASNLSLNSNAPAFTPRLSAKAPSFVPKKPAAAAAAAAAAPAPKAMSISIGGAPAPKEEPAAPKEEPAAPKEEPAAPKEEPAAPKEKPAKAAPAPAAALKKIEEKEEDMAEDEMLLDEHFKEHLNVIFIGHVDAGKSTLGGNILVLTDMVDKRAMEKIEREAKEAGRETWYLSWALDTNQEERAEGKTVECGRAFFETKRRRYTILDAPGHKNFVPSMLGGAAQADVAVLVISARKGEFETGFERGGQTREHAILAKTSGVSRLIVVINKMDDTTVQWDKARYDEIIKKLGTFLKQTGFRKSDLIYLPLSGYTGIGVKDRVGSACPWYSGPSLLEVLDGLDGLNRNINGPLRIPVSEKYKDMGTVISGKIESGHVKVNQKIVIMPERRTCEISAIYGENDVEEPSAVSGDNVRIKLRNLDSELVQGGNVLVDTKNPCKSTRTFEAMLVILEAKNIITAGFKSILHVHTAIEEVSLVKLMHKLNDKGQKSRKAPQFLKVRDKCIVRIEATKPICVERYEDFPQLGRFTLRDEGKTIAIGKIRKVLE
ncbi:translation termination factor GTPase eRF3 [Coemansia sp. RSA 552]|nr:translation termination factor GTPase eRF3 [Coemansia sp. RSA 552]